MRVHFWQKISVRYGQSENSSLLSSHVLAQPDIATVFPAYLWTKIHCFQINESVISVVTFMLQSQRGLNYLMVGNCNSKTGLGYSLVSPFPCVASKARTTAGCPNKITATSTAQLHCSKKKDIKYGDRVAISPSEEIITWEILTHADLWSRTVTEVPKKGIESDFHGCVRMN